jgi:hypothetical protein
LSSGTAPCVDGGAPNRPNIRACGWVVARGTGAGDDGRRTVGRGRPPHKRGEQVQSCQK